MLLPVPIRTVAAGNRGRGKQYEAGDPSQSLNSARLRCAIVSSRLGVVDFVVKILANYVGLTASYDVQAGWVAPTGEQHAVRTRVSSTVTQPRSIWSSGKQGPRRWPRCDDISARRCFTRATAAGRSGPDGERRGVFGQ